MQPPPPLPPLSLHLLPLCFIAERAGSQGQEHTTPEERRRGLVGWLVGGLVDLSLNGHSIHEVAQCK